MRRLQASRSIEGGTSSENTDLDVTKYDAERLKLDSQAGTCPVPSSSTHSVFPCNALTTITIAGLVGMVVT